MRKVKIITATYSGMLETKINEFLADSMEIKGIDIKYTHTSVHSNHYYTAYIYYHL